MTEKNPEPGDIIFVNINTIRNVPKISKNTLQSTTIIIPAAVTTPLPPLNPKYTG